MADYVTNTPISTPLPITNKSTDVDLNGFQFNYDIGMFFANAVIPVQLTLPPPFEGDM